MSSDGDIYCSKCNNNTEQTLMLSCDHNLCLLCAATILKKQQSQNFNSNQYIKCDKCNSLTELEPETIKQILNEGNENNNNYEEQNNNENYVIDNIDSNYLLDIDENYNNNNDNMNKFIMDKITNNPLNENQKINNKMTQNNNKKFNRDNNNTSSEINILNDLINNNKNMCKEHGELLNYLCLDCMSNCVCSECVVHGIHRNHEVLNIKKAYPLIFNKMQDLSKYVSDQIKEVALINETLSKKKNFINALVDRCKNEIHNTFEQIRIRLDNKEKEIINNTTNILKKNINEINNYDNLIQKKMSNLGNLIEQINNIINKKNELNTINYFCENKNMILAQAELNELKNLNDLDTFTNIKIEPDKLTLNKMLEGMNNFHFNINNINGLDNNNINRGQISNRSYQNIQKKNNIFGFPQNNNKLNNINNNMNMNINRNISNQKKYVNNNQLMQNIPNNNYMNQRQRGVNVNNQIRGINNNMQQMKNNQKINKNNIYRMMNNNIPNNIMDNNFY